MLHMEPEQTFVAVKVQNMLVALYARRRRRLQAEAERVRRRTWEHEMNQTRSTTGVLTGLSSSDNILIDFIPSLECNRKPSSICYRYVENMLSAIDAFDCETVQRKTIRSIVCWLSFELFNKGWNNMVKQPFVLVTIYQVSGYSHS